MTPEIMLAWAGIATTIIFSLAVYFFDIFGLREWFLYKILKYNLKRIQKQLGIELDSMRMLTGLDKVDCCIYALLLKKQASQNEQFPLSLEEIRKITNFPQDRILISLQQLEKNGLIQEKRLLSLQPRATNQFLAKKQLRLA